MFSLFRSLFTSLLGACPGLPAGEWGPRVATAGDLCVVLREAIFQSNNLVRLGQARLYVHDHLRVCVVLM
jgi:hypothetical protein